MGHKQYAIVLAGVDGESDRHAREDDDIVQWHQEQSTHQKFTFASCLRIVSRRVAVLGGSCGLYLSLLHLDYRGGGFLPVCWSVPGWPHLGSCADRCPKTEDHK